VVGALDNADGGLGMVDGGEICCSRRGTLSGDVPIGRKSVLCLLSRSSDSWTFNGASMVL